MERAARRMLIRATGAFAMTPTTPHDALFKAAFGQVDVARSELELVLPADVRRQLDLATLEVLPGSFVDEQLRHAHADLLYATRTADGREALVYVLFEHQSSFDGRMPLRLLRYMVRIWERWLADHSADNTLPVVIPVVLHHGPAGWQAAPELASMLDASRELLDAVRPYQPLFRFVLDDLAEAAADALASRALHAFGRLVQLGFWSWRSHARLRAAAPLMRRIVVRLARDERARRLLAQLYIYLVCGGEPGVDVRDVKAILLEIAGPEGEEDVVNAAEQLIEQGRVEGRVEGLEQGRAEGRAEGRVEGRVEGLEQGRAEGLRTAIGGVLAMRHIPVSAAGRARLAACGDVATLMRWHAKALTAASEADLFSGEDGC
jgi:predicted transposase YdaD